uniref:Myosin IXA n=1 Tax=Astatotilapia calliptera TaxID=8154 RepID=A0AAX7TS15_ASTCA
MGPAAMRRRLEDQEFTLRVYPGSLAEGTIYCPVTARKNTTAAEAIECLIERLHLDRTKCYVLAEVKEFGGEEWILNPSDCPVQRMMLWPRTALENRSGLCSGEDYRFLLREKNLDGSIHYGGSLQMWLRVTEERRRMVERGFLPQPAGSDPPCDLCALPELTERALLESLRARFRQEKIYTYVGSILIVINPFQFLPIYNPKYVKMYDNHTLGKLEPHIYAVADVAYHAMLQRRKNQCIVISGESGSGKTQSTNFLIHHLTALSQKGFASGVEQIILGAGPVLEAFGNAKTAHNNNSSRFGKFIQVNYQESGTVRGAYVEKYLLEKSRLVYQEHNERNYHVFYYLLAGASEEERKAFHLLKPEEYHYLNQVLEGEDLKHDFERLQLAMEMVGFLPTTRKQIFSLLSAILHLGNIRYKKKTYRDDSIDICNPEVLPIVSELLEVKEEMLLEALTTRKTVTVGERLIVPYKLAEAGTVRDSMAKSLYSALFDWIVFRTNHALLNNKDLEDSSKILSIGVLDIFGFEDYENNSFEQFCINFANERLQHYFNQHIFKLEQEEYRAEGITWHNIDYIDNSGCINLISKKPTALFHLLDEECNFPQASNQTLLDKFKRQHEGNSYIEFPTVMEPAFIIRHYAGKVKYGVKDFREKNTDHMRPDIVALLKSSKNAFICGLMGIDPVATFRWAVLRAYFRAHVAFREAGRRHTHKKTGEEHPAGSVYAVNHVEEAPLSNYFGLPPPPKKCQKESEPQKKRVFSEKFVNDPGFCAQHLLDIKSLRYLSSVTLHDRITKSLLHLHKKKKPPSISAQFQASLNKLMETLDQSEPYFVKCIRSNAEKLPLRFNDSLVLRQLRYTGMLETVRIRQSGYSSKYTFQDFVHHFHVLLPRGTSPTKSGVREFFRRIHLPPAGYQVGSTMVFLREAERQRLQTLLHQEVLRRIVMLQRRFRAVLERKHFVNMRRAACTIQRSWKNCCHRRALAATAIQTAWKGSRERRRYHRTHAAMIQLQARSRGYLARLRDFKEQHERLGEQTSLSAAMEAGRREPASSGLESYGQDISAQLPEDSKSVSLYGAEMEKEDDLERSRSTDESSHKNRSKRESRRMRELEQAQFSLELLKVRSTSLGGSLPEDPVPNSSSSSQQDEHHRHSPQGSPASQGSFEVLSVEDMETEGSGGYSSQLSVLQEQPKTLDIQLQQGLRDSNYNEKPVTELPNKVEAPRATFYIASDQSPAHEPKSESPSSSYRERRESTSRRPVVVLISMQKESPLEEGELLAAQTLERASQTGAPNAQMTPIAGLEIASDREQPLGVSTQAKRDIFVVGKSSKAPFTRGESQEGPGICSAEMDIKIALKPTCSVPAVLPTLQERKTIRSAKEAPSPVLDTKPPKAQKKSNAQTVIVEEHNGHIFKSTQYSIPTYCEYCSSLIWMMDRACVCKRKHYTQNTSVQNTHLGTEFGVELSRLTSEERTVPQLVEKLINYIEMHGLYTEGIYRKSGSTNKIKELRQGLDTDVSSVNLDDYNIHVIASVLKQWLRDLPSPLMTFELYEEFLRAMGQPDKREVINGVYSVIDQLSRTHLSTLERLIFHLVRIALQEETNRMSANALAIVFAPCILRCPDSIDPLQSVQDISKTTAYVHKLTLQFYSHCSLNARNLVYCCNYSLITSKCNCIFGLMSTKKTSASYILKRGFSRKTNISLSKCVQAYHRVPEHLCSVCFQFKWLSGPQVCGADHQRADEQVQGSSEGHQQSGVCREQSQEQADPHQEVHGKIKVQ